MSKCKIATWTYVPPQADEEPCFLYYHLVGTHDGRPFDITVGIEIDGRDAEYEQHSGLSMRWDAATEAERQRWDDLLVAFSETPDLEKDMADRTNAVLGC